ARKNEEACRAQKSRAKMRIVGRVPQPGADGAAEVLRRKMLRFGVRRFPPDQRGDHTKIAECIQPERRGEPGHADDDTRKSRTDCAADIDSDAVKSDRRGKIL